MTEHDSHSTAADSATPPAASHVLVINSGSSSLKYELFAMGEGPAEISLLDGQVERIGTPEAFAWQRLRSSQGGAAPDSAALEDSQATAASPRGARAVDAPDHAVALDIVFGMLAEVGPIGPVAAAQGEQCTLAAIGHRVVHGGAEFTLPTLLDDHVIERIADVGRFAPLHATANLAGINAARERCPDVPHVAVFDTAFHADMPARAREYALPRKLVEEHGVRRYGFHGTSHRYVSREAARLLGRPLAELKLITLHLGSGASAAAIDGGVSVDTSMGMTPLEGLIMGTRCGDIDPAVPLLIGTRTGALDEEIHRILNFESGLRGMCGDNDLRAIHARVALGDVEAEAALEAFCYRVQKYIGAYIAALGGADAIVFTAGVGENDPEVRRRVCDGLAVLGIELDQAANAGESGSGDSQEARDISAPDASTRVLVVPTDEELEIAREVWALVRQGG